MLRWLIKLSSITVYIYYFASLKDATHIEKETRVVPSQTTVEQLFLTLNDQYQFSISIQQLRVAINYRFESWSYQLKSNDIVGFIPPVSGG